MSFSYELIEKYKVFMGYTQDKQVIADIDAMTKGSMSDIKGGRRHLTANQCIFICKKMNIDFKPELIQLAIERSKTKEEVSAWTEVAKKISAACVAGLLLLTASFTQVQGAHSRIRHNP
ncbi:DUF3693 domain-containing protein [Pseudoalteromonas sp. ASV78]|uniref:DUF3693 domain-containing protein n=1 Tax=Pseudoalteromonas sp. ASV78 TaxID=3397851 RepID=UPI0039FBA129